MTARQILQTLLGNIANGIYANGGKLPSEANLCEEFGVARMTVRSALEELRRQGLIEKRNGTGSFLTRRAQRKSGIIGLVIPDFEAFEFFAGIHSEIASHCARLGYDVRLVFTRETRPHAAARDIRTQLQTLVAARAEGVIFRPYVAESQAAENRETVDFLRQAEIPVVLIDADITRPPERSDCDLVAVNNIDAGRRIADYLYGKGARHIDFLALNGKSSLNANSSNRLFGLAGELALLGNEQGVHTLPFAATNAKALNKLLHGKAKPDAIVCGNDETAAALIKTLARLGKRVPEDVAVVGFDDIALARSTQPPITTVSQPIRQIAATAFKTLLARIRYPNNDPREIYLVAPLVIRQSA